MTAFQHGCLPTREELSERLDYSPETGIFIRKLVSGERRPAGSGKNGYVAIHFRGRTFYAHRLAWFIMTGEWPMPEVDHWDRNRRNNRFSNLRLAKPKDQRGNQSISKNNTTGARGVSRYRGKFKAQITINWKSRPIGVFATVGEAASAYAEAAKRYFGEFANPEVIKPAPNPALAKFETQEVTK